MIAPLMQDLNINLTDIGFLSASFFYPYVLLQIPSGILIDRFGARILLSVGLAICAVAALLFGYSDQYSTAIYSRLLMGIASSPAVVGTMYLACRWFSKARFALLASIAEMIGMLGGAIGEGSLAHLVVRVGWRHSMFLVGIIGLVLALISLLIIRNQPPKQDAKAIRKQHKSIKQLCQTLLKACHSKTVWSGCLYGGFSFSVISGFGGLWAVPFLQKVYAYTVETSALISSMIFIGAGIGAYLSGYLACRFGEIKKIMLVSSVFALLCMVVIVFIRESKIMNFILFLIEGIAAGNYVLAFCHVKHNTCESINASAMGLTNMMCILLGAPILQPLVGNLLSYLIITGKSPIIVYQLGMLPFIVMLFFAVVIAVKIKKERG